MKIYKYKDLSNPDQHVHFTDIILLGKIWCALPEHLNDKNEFEFNIDCSYSKDTHRLLQRFQRQNQNSRPINDSSISSAKLSIIIAPIKNEIIDGCQSEIAVTSFTMLKDCSRLWDRYGGKGNGVIVEIEIPDHTLDRDYHKVKYVDIKKIHVDLFLTHNLNNSKKEIFKRILLTKTKEWAGEKEIRFLTFMPDPFFKGPGRSQNILHPITNITFGPCVPHNILNSLEEKIINHCKKHNIKITKLKSQ